jgi:putative transposase
MDWARILAYVTGLVDQELLARNEYLATENRILKGRLQLSDTRIWFGARRLGRHGPCPAGQVHLKSAGWARVL